MLDIPPFLSVIVKDQSSNLDGFPKRGIGRSRRVLERSMRREARDTPILYGVKTAIL
jgi:hypothetical protein